MADEYETEGYNGLRDPLDSARDWHRILEYNINETDESLIKRAPLSERPDPGQGNDDRLFLATDIGVLYRDTGTSWEVSGGTDLDDADLTAKRGSVVVWDSANEEVPQAQLGGPAASLSQYPLANADLANSSVTVAGNSVALGGSTGVSYTDLSDTAASFPIPEGDLAKTYGALAENETVTGAWSFDSAIDLVDGVTGNKVIASLGDDAELLDVDTADTVRLRGQATPGVGALQLGDSGAEITGNGNGDVDVTGGGLYVGGTNVTLDSRFPLPNSDLANSSVTVAGNSVALGGSTAIAHADLSNIGSADHHTRYADSEAQTAVEGSVNVEDLVTASATAGHVARSQGDGTLLMEALAHGDLADAPADAHHAQNHGNADHSTPMVEDGIQNADSPYQIQKNGTDGAGIINFKT